MSNLFGNKKELYCQACNNLFGRDDLIMKIEDGALVHYENKCMKEYGKNVNKRIVIGDIIPYQKAQELAKKGKVKCSKLEEIKE